MLIRAGEACNACAFAHGSHRKEPEALNPPYMRVRGEDPRPFAPTEACLGSSAIGSRMSLCIDPRARRHRRRQGQRRRQARFDAPGQGGPAFIGSEGRRADKGEPATT